MGDKPKALSWAVWRQDDNGGRFLVDVKPTEAEARARMATLAGLGHRQIYWCEPRAPALAARQTESHK